jgi:hypothetical protein
MFRIEPDKYGGQDSDREPSGVTCAAQLQLDVFSHGHERIVLPRPLIRSLSHRGDMSVVEDIGCRPLPVSLCSEI